MEATPSARVARGHRRSRALAVAIGALLLGSWSERARAAGDEPPALGAPSVEACVSAFERAASALRRWPTQAIPEFADAPGEGVLVTLRWEGRLLGQGQVVGLPGRREPDAMGRALREALAQGEGRLPVAHDALRSQNLARLAGEMVLSIEFAGVLVPFRADTYDEVEQGISPGLWGLGARAGERVGVVFPSSAMLNGLTPGEALRGAIAPALDDPGAALHPTKGTPGALRRSAGLTLYRFEVVHLAEPFARAHPLVLHRGARVVAVGEALGRAGESLESLVEHVLARTRGGVIVEMVGPTRAQRREGTGLVGRALAGFSLARAAGTPGVRPELAARARERAVELLRAIEGDAGELGAGDGALVLVALRESGADLPGLEGRARAACASALVDGRWGEGLSTAVRGLIACALSGGGGAGDLCRRVHEDASGLAGALPWLLWAEEREGVLGATRESWRLAREGLWAVQVGPDAAGADDRDLVGGMVLGGGSALPNWHTLRASAGLAAMIRLRECTDAKEVGVELARVQDAMRFARQLMVDESSAWMYEDPGEAMGGVRAAGWDLRLPLDASAAGLVAWSETLRTMDWIRRGAGGAPPGP